MKLGMLLVFFVAAICLHQKNVYGFNQNRIVNGSATPNGVFEFLPKLIFFMEESKGKTTGGTCSSTIISKRHILTAAHCLFMGDPIHEESETTWNRLIDGIFVKPRYETYIDSPKNFWINKYSLQTRYYFHQSYDLVSKYYADIAIIEFPDGTNLNVTPVTLASNYTEQPEMGIIAGYGIYKWDFDAYDRLIPERPKVLQNGTVPLYAYNPDHPYAIFAANAHRHGDEGDSGGPLMIERNGKFYQIGVASLKISMEIWPGVVNSYTRISTFCDWISKITKNEANCEPVPDIDPNHTTPPPYPGPIQPSQPPPLQPIEPNDKATTKSNTDVTDAPAPPGPYDETDAPPQPANTEAQSDANVAFTFNVLLFLLMGVFFFA